MLEEYLENEKNIVDAELDKFFNETLKAKSIQNTLLADYINKVKDFLLPEINKPKRLHPIILISAFSGIANRQYMGEMLDEIRAVSIAVEFLHNAKIIHDDLIDGDEIRRGAPSYHIMWANFLKEMYDQKGFPEKDESASQFGWIMALLGGSFSNFLGTRTILKSTFDDKLKFYALSEYNTASNYMTQGLIIEAYMKWNKITMSLEQYLNIAELKTARPLEKAAKIGAILARGNDYFQINFLSEFMLKFGQAYSIKDDLLDLEKDIKHGEKKFPYIICIQNTNEKQQKLLNELYGKPDINKSEIEEIYGVMEENQCLLICQQFAMNLIAQAKSSLNEIYPAFNAEQEEFFNELLEFGFSRSY